MTYLIWKIQAASGIPVRVMPILYRSLEMARTDAAALNQRFPKQETGVQYVAREAQVGDADAISHRPEQAPPAGAF